jgi:hypothetical protein
MGHILAKTAEVPIPSRHDYGRKPCFYLLIAHDKITDARILQGWLPPLPETSLMSENRQAARSAAAVKAWNTRKGVDGRRNKVRTPHFPLYSTVRHMLRILPGVSKAALKSMMRVIDEQTGTPRIPSTGPTRTRGSVSACRARSRSWLTASG